MFEIECLSVHRNQICYMIPESHGQACLRLFLKTAVPKSAVLNINTHIYYSVWFGLFLSEVQNRERKLLTAPLTIRESCAVLWTS